MKAKYTISATLKPNGEASGLEHIRTDMLVFTKLSGMGLGAEPQAIDDRLGGKLTRKMKQRNFTGELGQHVSLRLDDDSPQRNILMCGLGSSANYCGLKSAVKTAVDQALAKGCNRLTVPVPRSRVSALNLNLAGLGYAIKEAVEEALSDRDGAGTLEVQIVCTGHQRRFLQQGVSAPLRSRRICCDAN